MPRLSCRAEGQRRESRPQCASRLQVQGLYVRPEAAAHAADMRRRAAIEPVIGLISRPSTAWAAMLLHTMPAMPLTPCWPPPVITSISCLDGWSSCCLDSWRLKMPRPPFNGSENRKLHGRRFRLSLEPDIIPRPHLSIAITARTCLLSLRFGTRVLAFPPVEAMAVGVPVVAGHSGGWLKQLCTSHAP